ncbi:hypothetical protein IFM61392_04260 [Aspergillus lentulus]|nr:hypothetical protein IFM61392_04260 [Aspergillus lentulus]
MHIRSDMVTANLLISYPRTTTNSRTVITPIQAKVIGAAVRKVVYTMHAINNKVALAWVLVDGGKEVVITTRVFAFFPGDAVVLVPVDLLASADFDGGCAADSDGKGSEDYLGDLHDGWPRKNKCWDLELF